MSISMIYCPKCGSANRRGSRFCNECGEPLPTHTALRCPMCGAMNPVGNVYCDRCQARLVPMTATPPEEKRYEPPPIKGLSLPTIPLEEKKEEAPPAATEDWLAQLRPAAIPQDVTREESLPPPETGREADWLEQLRAASAAQETGAEEADAWLRQLRESIPPVSPPLEPEPLAPAELPDWLRGVAPPEAPEEAVPTAELPDWLRGVAPPEAPEEAIPTAELPDWLRGVAPPEAPEEAIPTAELPDWLREIAPPEAPEEAIPTAELPDWLRGVAPPEAPEEAIPTAELPDWLREIAPPEAPEEAIPTAELPDWLREIAPPEVPEEAIPTAELPDWLRGVAPPEAPEEAIPTAELPDWLRGVAPPEAPEEAIPTAELPDWLREVAPPEAPPGPLKSPIVPPLLEFPSETATGEIPDWLIELGKEVAPGAPAPPEIEAGGVIELARAEIPPWLEAMRPRPEAPLKEPVETEGLLAGLSGVLSPVLKLEVPAVRKRPPAAEIKEAPLARAQLLQRLLTQPIEVPQPEVRRRGSGLGARIQGWLVTVVLIVAVVGTLLVPRILPGTSLPVHLDTSPARSVYGIIQGLSAPATALVALEYGVAEADEMNLVAEPLLRHLLRQGAHLSIVTTQPEGKLIAEDMLRTIAAPESLYTIVEYRPAGATGISQLLAGAREKPGVILLLTARPASLRWWIEQTQARGEKLTLVAGLSAALEPAAAPYLNAGALQAALYGLGGAAAYESEGGLPGRATERLDALVAGHLAVIALILIGAIIHTLAGPSQEGRR